MISVRTDLAMETCSGIQKSSKDYPGIDITEEIQNGIQISRVAVKYQSTAKKIGKPVGNYTTLFFEDFRYMDKKKYEGACRCIAAEIRRFLQHQNKNKPILIIGLGNRSITSDSLGPCVIDKLMITRHLFSYAPQTLTENLNSVCAIAPGVLGITGIETEEIISAVCEKIQPGAVICVDALAARSLDRITRTVQISDTGIHPGAGVGNNRKEISVKTLGIPVIAVGVPTVVDAATITDDVLGLVLSYLAKNSEDNIGCFLKNIDENQRTELIRTCVADSIPYFMTTPKEIDILIRKTAEVIANGINFALHENITFEDIDIYVS